MNVSIFNVLGPIMIGPSSSHTAGAARLGRVASLIAGRPFTRVSFGLHGSFAKTYRGHGTDKALLAGVMGLREDDERLVDAVAIADECGLAYDFHEIDLIGMHENSAKISFWLDNGGTCEVVGSSIGGGQILIRGINGFSFAFSAESPTLIVTQNDKKGVIRDLSGILADNDINIGVLTLSRRAKGDIACCAIEVDSGIPDSVVRSISALPNILDVRAIPAA